MYHRVADVAADPWHLSVRPDRFEAQLDALRKHFEVVALADIQSPSPSGRTAVAITFDDGYLDNLRNALPRLETHECPATLFVVSGTIGQTREFWWDEIEAIVLAPGPLPRHIELDTHGASFSRDLGTAADDAGIELAADQDGDVFESRPGSRRHFFLEIWEFLYGLDNDVRERQLDVLWQWAGRERATREGCRPMNADELRVFAKSPLVEIGAHTVNHRRLPTLPADDMRREILQSADHLTHILGDRPRSFSFPFGQRCTPSMTIVRDHFDRAVLTKPGVITEDTPPHQLNRLAVRDWPAERFLDEISALLRSAPA